MRSAMCELDVNVGLDAGDEWAGLINGPRGLSAEADEQSYNTRNLADATIKNYCKPISSVFLVIAATEKFDLGSMEQ